MLLSSKGLFLTHAASFITGYLTHLKISQGDLEELKAMKLEERKKQMIKWGVGVIGLATLIRVCSKKLLKKA